MPIVQLPTEQRFVLWDADWETYESMLEAVGDRPVRLTYDRGKLELMTLSLGHERCAEILGQMIVVLTDELDMPRLSGGSTTFKSKDLDRGLEPDKCFYLVNEHLVRAKDEIDLDVDPPPDVAIEIDISRSSLNRMGIYAAIRVAEVWRYDGETLTIFRLDDQGKYQQVECSGFFPFLTAKDLADFLKRRHELGESGLLRAFREWVRGQRTRGWPPADTS
jgi:Uma2 family endonuclease